MGRRSGVRLDNKAGLKIFNSKGGYILRESGAGYIVRNDADTAGGDFTANSVNTNSGITGTQRVGTSGTVIRQLAVVTQFIDVGGALASGGSTIIETAFSSGAAGIIGSGDYTVPLTQSAETGYVLLPHQTTTGDSIRFEVLSIGNGNVNPAMQSYTFLVLRG